MHISCERCATVYVLDDKLIPPGGAPVQCTRCGLVFTAYPGRASAHGAARPAPPPPVRRAPGAEAGAKRVPPSLGRQATPPQATQLFGASPFAEVATNRGAGDATLVPHRGEPQGGIGEEGSSGTMIFGSPARPSAEEDQSSSKTVMFGSPARPSAEEDQSSSKTVMFGAPARPAQPEAEAGDSSRTMVFGAPARSSSESARAPAKAAALGAAATPARAEPAPASPALDPSAGGREGVRGEPEAASAGQTMVFGAPKPPMDDSGVEVEGPPASGSDRTLVFGRARPAGAPGATSEEQSSRPPARPTQMFGVAQPALGDSPEADVSSSGAPAVEIPAVPLPAQRPAAEEPEEEGLARAETPPAGESPLGASQAVGAELEGAEAPPAAGPGGGPLAEPASGAVWPKRPLPAPPPRPGTMKAGAQTVQLQLALKKSQRRLPMIVGGAALGLLVVLGAAAFFALRTPKADSAVLAADASALNLMKRDDTASLKQAIAAWQAIQAKDPKYLPAQANQIMAYTLLTHDLGEEIRRLKARAELARAEMEKGAGEKREELVKLNAQMEPLIEEARKSDEAAGKLLASCKEAASSSPDSAAVFRASAVYFGVKGNDNAERLAQIYRRAKDERGVLHDDARAFADLALSALYAQPRPDRREKGAASARDALQKDPALTRARLIQAKLLIAARDYAGARKVVGEIVAANPAHLAAGRLMQDIEFAAAHPEQASP